MSIYNSLYKSIYITLSLCVLLSLSCSRSFVGYEVGQPNGFVEVEQNAYTQTLRMAGGLSRLAAKLVHDPESDLANHVNKWLGPQAQSTIIDFANKPPRMSSGGEDRQISRSLTPAEIQEKLGEIFPSQILVFDSDKKLRLDIRVENERRTSRPDHPRDPKDLVIRFELWDDDRRVAHADMEMSYDSVYTAFVKNAVFSSEGYINPVNALEVLPLYSYHRGGQYKGVGLSLMHILFKAAYIMGAHDLELVAGHSMEPWYRQVVGMGQLQNGHMIYYLRQEELASIKYLEQGIHIRKVDPDPIYSVESNLIQIHSLQRLIKAAAVHAQAETNVPVSAYIVGSIRYLQSGLNRNDVDIELIINADKAKRKEAQKIFESYLKELLRPVRVHDITSQQSVANVDWLLDYGRVQKSFEIYIHRNKSKAAKAKLYTIQRSLKTSLTEGRINRLKDLQFWIAAEYYIGSEENHAAMLKEFDNGIGDLRAFEGKWRDRILELNQEIDLLQDELLEIVSERAEADLPLSRMSDPLNPEIDLGMSAEEIQGLLAEAFPDQIEVDGEDKEFAVRIEVDSYGKSYGLDAALIIRLELIDGIKAVGHVDILRELNQSERALISGALFSTSKYTYRSYGLEVNPEYSFKRGGLYKGVGKSLMHMAFKASYLLGANQVDVKPRNAKWYIDTLDMKPVGNTGMVKMELESSRVENSDYLLKNLKIQRSRRKQIRPNARMASSQQFKPIAQATRMTNGVLDVSGGLDPEVQFYALLPLETALARDAESAIASMYRHALAGPPMETERIVRDWYKVPTSDPGKAYFKRLMSGYEGDIYQPFAQESVPSLFNIVNHSAFFVKRSIERINSERWPKCCGPASAAIELSIHNINLNYDNPFEIKSYRDERDDRHKHIFNVIRDLRVPDSKPWLLDLTLEQYEGLYPEEVQEIMRLSEEYKALAQASRMASAAGKRLADQYFQGDQRLFNISARLTRGDEWGLGSDEYAWPAHKSVPQKPAQQKRLVMSDLYSMSIKAALVQDKKAADVIWSHLGDQGLQAKPVNVLIDLDQYLKRANPAEQKLVQAQFEWARSHGIARIRFMNDRPGFISDARVAGEEVESLEFRFWSLSQHGQLETNIGNNLPFSDKNFVAPLIPILHMHIRQALQKEFNPHLKDIEDRLFKFMTGRRKAITDEERIYLAKYQSDVDVFIYEEMAADLPMLNEYLNFMIWAESLKRSTSGISA